MVSAEWKTPVHMPPHLHEAIGSDDLIYSSVAYVAKNYSSRITLEKMANDLGVSMFYQECLQKHFTAILVNM